MYHFSLFLSFMHVQYMHVYKQALTCPRQEVLIVIRRFFLFVFRKITCQDPLFQRGCLLESINRYPKKCLRKGALYFRSLSIKIIDIILSTVSGNRLFSLAEMLSENLIWQFY